MGRTTTAVAPGKVILFGEHAVVYGQPAIAAPVTQVRATAAVTDADHAGVLLRAPDLGREWWLADAPADHPLAAAVHAFTAETKIEPRDLTITVHSEIPIAGGLGSGAAIAAALIRALLRHTGRSADGSMDEEHAAVSRMTYEVERIHHGTPSGIDNTVVAYERPVYFVRDNAPAPQADGIRHTPTLETFSVGSPLHLLIADTGIKAPTRESVGDVRRFWQAEPAEWEPLFAACGRIARQAKRALAEGDASAVGALMGENQALLQRMTVSSAALKELIQAAVEAGALGAKLSGGGRGGNMIALVTADTADAVCAALQNAGAVRVLSTVLGA